MVSAPKVKGVHGIAWLALLGAIVIAVAFPIEVTRSWPPKFNPEWPHIWYSCLFVLVLAVGSCFFLRSAENEIVATLATGLVLALSWFPLASYFENYHTYPRHVLILLSLVSIVGGFLARMRVLAFMSLAFATSWLLPLREGFL